MVDSNFKAILTDIIPFWFNIKFQACRNLLIDILKDNGYDNVKNQNNNLSLSEVKYRKDQIHYLFRDYDEEFFYELYLWIFLNEKGNTIRLGVSYRVTTREDGVRVIDEYYAFNVNHDYEFETEAGIFNEKETNNIESFKKNCNLLIKKYKERSLKKGV